jgi:hypothetical protein
MFRNRSDARSAKAFERYRKRNPLLNWDLIEAVPEMEATLQKKVTWQQRGRWGTRVMVSSLLLFSAITIKGDYDEHKFDEAVEAESNDYLGDVTNLERRLKQFTQKITGKKVDFFCTPQEYLGNGDPNYEVAGVFLPAAGEYGDAVYIDESLCMGIMSHTKAEKYQNGLGELLYENSDQIAIDGALAVGHEIGHAMGVRNEGKANCVGVVLYPRACRGAQNGA